MGNRGKNYGSRIGREAALIVFMIWIVWFAITTWDSTWLLIVLAGIIALAIWFFVLRKYKNEAYYKITKRPYLTMRLSVGYNGEYLTYKNLQYMENAGAKFLFNVYIPKANGETTEIDVMMICTQGIFVLESKNYSGWIFGSVRSKNWYQTLPAGRRRSLKEHFYNPIMQNRSHVKHLMTFLGKPIPVWSIIVFSNRCTLKSIQVDSRRVHVLNRRETPVVVSAICDRAPEVLTEEDILEIYDVLYPFTQVDAEMKARHIANINRNIKGEPAVQSAPTLSVPDKPEKKISEVNVSEQSTDQTELSEMAVAETVEATEITESKTCGEPTQEAQEQKCPWCNGLLILRTATRGANAGNQFYGCSNYPHCKYIRNIQNEEQKAFE